MGGIDLSRTTDLTACAAIIEKEGRLYVFAQFFLPAERIEAATARDGLPYAAYVQRGLLVPSGDNFVDYHDCFVWYRNLVEQFQIYPLKVGYDRYTAQYLVQDMKQYGFHMDDVWQGYNLTPVIRETEGLMRDGVFRIGDNDLLKAHLLDASLKIEGGERPMQAGEAERHGAYRRRCGSAGRYDRSSKVLRRDRGTAEKWRVIVGLFDKIFKRPSPSGHSQGFSRP